jgi:hypothetical protein
MSSRALLAVSLFIGSLLAANAVTTKSSFDWSVGPVISGGSVQINVKVAPCHPVTVTLYAGGREIHGTIPEVPGTCTLQVPAGTAGQGWVIEVQCPNSHDSKSGQIL